MVILQSIQLSSMRARACVYVRVSKLAFSKISFRNTIIALNSWDPDLIESDLCPNCLQRILAGDTSGYDFAH